MYQSRCDLEKSTNNIIENHQYPNKNDDKWRDLLAFQFGNRALVLGRREKAYICKLAN